MKEGPNKRKRMFNQIQTKVFKKQFELSNNLEKLITQMIEERDKMVKERLKEMDFIKRLKFAFFKKV